MGIIRYYPDPDDSDIVFNIPVESDESVREDAGRSASPQKNEGDSDSDEAPEEISFSTARDIALNEEKNVRETQKQISDKLKEKRRKAQELIQEQKKSSLASKRLPDEILDELSSEPEISKPSTKKSKIPLPATKLQKVANKLNQSADFIPLSKESNESTEFKLAVLEKKSWTPGYFKSSKVVADFRQKALFGSRNRREPASAQRQAQQKQQAAGKSVL